MALFDPQTTIKIKVDKDVAEDFEELCQLRGLTQEQMFRVMIRGYAKRKVVFDLHEELTFGKYNGLRLEEVLRADTQYISWLLRESTWFRISTAAERLREEMEEE